MIFKKVFLNYGDSETLLLADASCLCQCTFGKTDFLWLKRI